MRSFRLRRSTTGSALRGGDVLRPLTPVTLQASDVERIDATDGIVIVTESDGSQQTYPTPVRIILEH